MNSLPPLPTTKLLPKLACPPQALLQPFLSGRAWRPAPTPRLLPRFLPLCSEKNQKNKLADALTKNKVSATVLALRVSNLLLGHLADILTLWG